MVKPIHPSQRETTADNKDIIDLALHLSKPKAGYKRSPSFPRFIVNVDEGHVYAKGEASLRKVLSTIRQGEVCWVFRNSGYGATIAFEKPEFVKQYEQSN